MGLGGSIGIESLENRQLMAVNAFSVRSTLANGDTGNIDNPTLVVSGSTSLPVNFPTIVDGQLRINGTTGNDQFVISRTNNLELTGKVGYIGVVKSDGQTSLLPTSNLSRIEARDGVVLMIGSDVPSGPFLRIQTAEGLIFVQSDTVTSIKVDAGAGNDKVAIAKNVKLPTVLIGARGNDTLEGGTASDTLSGGAGDDSLFGGHGPAVDLVETGSGGDTVRFNKLDDIRRESGVVHPLVSNVDDDDLLTIAFETGSTTPKFVFSLRAIGA